MTLQRLDICVNNEMKEEKKEKEKETGKCKARSSIACDSSVTLLPIHKGEGRASAFASFNYLPLFLSSRLRSIGRRNRMIYLRLCPFVEFQLHHDSLSSLHKKKKRSNKEHDLFFSLALIRIAAYRCLFSLVVLIVEQKVMTASRRKKRVLDTLAERARRECVRLFTQLSAVVRLTWFVQLGKKWQCSTNMIDECH